MLVGRPARSQPTLRAAILGLTFGFYYGKVGKSKLL